MAETTEISAQRTRTRQLIWPREHGAWGILFVPLLTGAWIGLAEGGPIARVLLLAVAAFSLFCLRTPVESLLGTAPVRVANRRERSIVLRFAVLFASASAISLAGLFWRGNNLGLLLLGVVAAVLFAAQLLVKRLGRKTRMASQVIGALGLTATAPAAYYAASGGLDVVAYGLWFANWIFAGNQIHFVQLRLHASRCRTWQERWKQGRGFFLGQFIMMMALIVAWAFRVVPGLVFVAFVPIFVRGTMWFLAPPGPLKLHRLGLSELAHSIAFGTLLVICLI